MVSVAPCAEAMSLLVSECSGVKMLQLTAVVSKMPQLAAKSSGQLESVNQLDSAAALKMWVSAESRSGGQVGNFEHFSSCAGHVCDLITGSTNVPPPCFGVGRIEGGESDGAPKMGLVLQSKSP